MKNTDMDEKEYNEAFQRAKELHDSGNALTKRQMEIVFPQLAESEDERNWKSVERAIRGFLTNPIDADELLAWLEKQKELPFVKDVILGYPGLYFYDGERMHFQGNPAMEENQEKKKEPHYTKRNALFDKCVKNCEPKTVEEVNKRVDDIMNISELSAFEQALTNFIGDWEDDEERWPSKFVKKHGKHILDMAREELQKEQGQPEVDFAEEIKTLSQSKDWEQMKKRGSYMKEALYIVAHHFYRLGLKARKEK